MQSYGGDGENEVEFIKKEKEKGGFEEYLNLKKSMLKSCHTIQQWTFKVSIF